MCTYIITYEKVSFVKFTAVLILFVFSLGNSSKGGVTLAVCDFSFDVLQASRKTTLLRLCIVKQSFEFSKSCAYKQVRTRMLTHRHKVAFNKNMPHSFLLQKKLLTKQYQSFFNVLKEFLIEINYWNIPSNPPNSIARDGTMLTFVLHHSYSWFTVHWSKWRSQVTV